MKKIEHLGIAVNNLKEANKTFKKLLGKAHYKVESVEREGVSTSFFTLGESKIELLEASSEDSAIQKFIDKRECTIKKDVFISKEFDKLKIYDLYQMLFGNLFLQCKKPWISHKTIFAVSNTSCDICLQVLLLYILPGQLYLDVF